MRLSGTDRADLRSRLAAEYVLGTMIGGARRRFEGLAREDRSIREEVELWQSRLTPLAARVPEIAPPARVWKKIEARIRGERLASQSALGMVLSGQNASKSPVDSAVSPTGWWSSLVNSLGFWRSLGTGASTLAGILLFAIWSGNVPDHTDPVRTAVLEDPSGARMVIEQSRGNLLEVKMVKPWKARAESSFQLWVLPKEGAPRSIGLISQDGQTKITLQDLESLLQDGAQFAVTREAKGGSPTGQPTTPILCKGVIARMPAKRLQGTGSI